MLPDNKLIYAIDFDGTLFENKFPSIGKPNLKLIKAMIEKRKLGNKLILWTCRSDQQLEDAISLCTLQGLEFDAINDDIPETKAMFPRTGRKILYDVLIDDKNMDNKEFDLPYIENN